MFDGVPPEPGGDGSDPREPYWIVPRSIFPGLMIERFGLPLAQGVTIGGTFSLLVAISRGDRWGSVLCAFTLASAVYLWMVAVLRPIHRRLDIPPKGKLVVRR